MQPAGPQQVFTQPRYAPQNPREMKEWPPQEKTEVFREGLKRHLEVYDFENSLAQVCVALHWNEHKTNIS